MTNRTKAHLCEVAPLTSHQVIAHFDQPVHILSSGEKLRTRGTGVTDSVGCKVKNSHLFAVHCIPTSTRPAEPRTDRSAAHHIYWMLDRPEW